MKPTNPDNAALIERITNIWYDAVGDVDPKKDTQKRLEAVANAISPPMQADCGEVE